MRQVSTTSGDRMWKASSVPYTASVTVAAAAKHGTSCPGSNAVCVAQSAEKERRREAMGGFKTKEIHSIVHSAQNKRLQRLDSDSVHQLQPASKGRDKQSTTMHVLMVG